MTPGHPLWQCGLRPFFSAATGSALVAVLPWVALLGLGLPLLPAGAVPATQWHALLLLGGMGFAAVAGFLLTAIPEFTATAGFGPAPIRRLTALWAIAFAADAIAQTWSLALAAAAWAAFALQLLALVLPRVWAQPQRPHRSFVWAVAALGAGVVGWHVALLSGSTATHWPPLLTSLYMVLVVLSMSRISMRIVNDALDALRLAGRTRFDGPYLARPPRRNLAIALITLHAAVQAAWPTHKAAGWLALAVAAAVFNVLQDWHVGRALLRKWPLLLVLVYWAMALGYAGIGWGQLTTDAGWLSAGRHVLSLAVFGLSIFCVFAIAGRNHIGLALDERRWVPLTATLLLLSAALRAGASTIGPAWLMPASGLAWLAAFGLAAWRLVPLWWRARADGLYGCEGPAGGASERC
ncbi:MAG: NnrS family protein [Rubrivivax sp.]